MALVGDIFQVSVKYRDQDMKLFQNDYFYRLSVIDGDADINVCYELATAFISDLLPTIRASTPTSWTFYEIRAKSLFNLADDFAAAISLAGTRPTPASPGDQMLPSFAAVKITASTDNGLVKKGRKMFGGVFEGDQSFGLLLIASLPIWAQLAVAFAANVVYEAFTVDLTWQPVVVQRIREEIEGRVTYRLPTSQLEAVFGVIQNAVFSTIVTTQNSRKD